MNDTSSTWYGKIELIKMARAVSGGKWGLVAAKNLVERFLEAYGIEGANGIYMGVSLMQSFMRLCGAVVSGKMCFDNQDKLAWSVPPVVTNEHIKEICNF